MEGLRTSELVPAVLGGTTQISSLPPRIDTMNRGGRSADVHSHDQSREKAVEATPLLLGALPRPPPARAKIVRVFSSYLQFILCGFCVLLTMLLLTWLLSTRSSSTIAPADVIIIGAGSSSPSAVVPFCNPFSLNTAPVNLTHHHGLVSYLYLLPLSLFSSANSVAYYLKYAAFANSTFFFSALNTPTRLFTRSFAGEKVTSGADVLVPSHHFLLSFHTRLVPNHPQFVDNRLVNASYQFALISDDGSILYTGDVSEHEQALPRTGILIRNDGVHTTRISYTSPHRPLIFPPGHGVNLILHYFQGPPPHIALQLLYRLMRQDDEQNEEAEEIRRQKVDSEVEDDDNDLYWEVRAEGATSLETERYVKLLDRGWSVVPEEWYWLPTRYYGKEQVDEWRAAGVDPCSFSNSRVFHTLLPPKESEEEHKRAANCAMTTSASTMVVLRVVAVAIALVMTGNVFY